MLLVCCRKFILLQVADLRVVFVVVVWLFRVDEIINFFVDQYLVQGSVFWSVFDSYVVWQIKFDFFRMFWFVYFFVYLGYLVRCDICICKNSFNLYVCCELVFCDVDVAIFEILRCFYFFICMNINGGVVKCMVKENRNCDVWRIFLS